MGPYRPLSPIRLLPIPCIRASCLPRLCPSPMPVPLLPSQSVPWDIAYHVAVHREAGKLPNPSQLPASSAAAMAASARTAATGRHQGPSALLTRRAGGGGGRGGGMTGGLSGTGRSSREPPGTDSGHEGLPFIHNGGGQMVGASVDAAAGSLQVQAADLSGPAGLSHWGREFLGVGNHSALRPKEWFP